MNTSVEALALFPAVTDTSICSCTRSNCSSSCTCTNCSISHVSLCSRNCSSTCSTPRLFRSRRSHNRNGQILDQWLSFSTTWSRDQGHLESVTQYLCSPTTVQRHKTTVLLKVLQVLWCCQITCRSYFTCLGLAFAVVTWLARLAMVAKVVMGVAIEALAAAIAPSATVVETLPVTVPRLDTPVGDANSMFACTQVTRFLIIFLPGIMFRTKAANTHHSTTTGRGAAG